jgi:hypothetical protein
VIERLDGSEREVSLEFARGLPHLRRLKMQRGFGVDIVWPRAAYDREAPRGEDWPEDET